MSVKTKIKMSVIMSILILCVIQTALADIIYVDQSRPGGGNGTTWKRAYPDLQDAIGSAVSTDRIFVAQGTYTAGMNRSDSFQLKNGVEILGGYAGYLEPNPDDRDIDAYPTVLSGDINGDDGPDFLDYDENCYHIVNGSSTNDTAILDGFTITGGNADGSYPDNYGGGLHINAGSPTISYCTFTNNKASHYGGGSYNIAASPTISYCTFTNNETSRGGGLYNEMGNPTISNCTFGNNKASSRGGGLYNHKASPIISYCTFIDNGASNGGGMFNYYSSSNPTLTKCVFIGNLADSSGGAIESSGLLTLINCLLHGNTADSSGGALRSSRLATLINCTITGNTTANYSGGGIFALGTLPTLTNCILWGNTDADSVTIEEEQYSVYSGTPTINNSCIQGWTGVYGGTGNTGGDPLLADADGADNITGTSDDNVRLLPGSAALDTGDNSAVPGSLTTDLDGNPRIVNGTVDMGPYEGANQGFILDSEDITVPEGGTAIFTVALAMDPLATVGVTVAYQSGDTDITVDSGASFTFNSSNYSIPVEITLGAGEDADYYHSSTLIRISAAGVPTAGVTATEVDDEPVPTILYVDKTASGANYGTSWLDAYTDMTVALDTASIYSEVQQVYIAEGTYCPAGPGGNRKTTFEIGNGLAVYGGFAAGGGDLASRDPAAYPTILSGDLNGDDGPGFANNGENSIHVVSGEGLDSTTILDGLTIKGGNANVGDYGETAVGGGFYCFGEPQIINCTFTENSANERGGAMHGTGDTNLTDCTFIANSAGNDGGAFYSSEGSNITLTNCAFTGNSTVNEYSRGGGLYNRGDSIINNCTFDLNTSAGDGGGLYNYELFSHTTVRNCTFTDNTAENDGGGLYNHHSDMTLIDCRFISNSAANNGGGMHNDFESTQTLVNCIFNGNTATSGGAISNASSFSLVTSLINCTLTANMAPNGNAVACVGSYKSTFDIVNSILWNGGNEIDNASTELSIITVSYSDIHTGPTGSGNINVDPMFADADGLNDIAGDEDDDLRLSAGSACIDAGDNSAVALDDFDLDGDGNTAERTPLDLDDVLRFFDDPATVDTGNGVVPIVDIGAYEYGSSRGIGDFDADGYANYVDFGIFALAWQTDSDDADWNKNCDIYMPKDNSIDINDLAIFADDWLN